MQRRAVESCLAGVLCANSLPHLATAVSGHRHLTPLAGKGSGRWVNLAWGGANLVAGLALASRQRGGPQWDARLLSFEAGSAGFAAWMAISERVIRVNWA